ncbi:hypothetical protein AVEN_3416-1 [Araneus ventricosus]|uniref:STPR domain-containing protein n=1 Tax=Araneus ventricosus TaxID=182803 RepID=A0A4Y2I6L0_ARAVE|nr:hypothetical protein AVEN_3416-1 [Araneus ventricosus]
MPKRKRGINGMMPVDRRQLENVKGKLLKLTKKETMAQRSLDRRAEESEGQRNSRLSAMERRAEETEEQRNTGLSDMAQRGQERKAEEIEEQRNGRLVRQDVSRDLKE